MLIVLAPFSGRSSRSHSVQSFFKMVVLLLFTPLKSGSARYTCPLIESIVLLLLFHCCYCPVLLLHYTLKTDPPTGRLCFLRVFDTEFFYCMCAQYVQ